MGLTRLGILSLFVGDDDHAANLCVGGLCGQNQWAALWAKPVFCYLWVCPSVGRSLLRHGPICKCQSGGAPLQPALAITKQSCGRRPWQNAKRTAHLRRISGYQARVAHLRSSNICQLLLQPNTHHHQHQGIMNTFT